MANDTSTKTASSKSSNVFFGNYLEVYTIGLVAAILEWVFFERERRTALLSNKVIEKAKHNPMNVFYFMVGALVLFFCWSLYKEKTVLKTGGRS